MKIIIPAPLDINNDHLDILRLQGIELFNDIPQSLTETIDRVKDAGIIVASKISVDKQLIDKIPKLRYIVTPSVGYEWVDVDYARSKGIVVMNCPRHNSIAVAEHSVMLAMAAKRKLVQANQGLKEGTWYNNEYVGSEIFGKQVGIIGKGRVGELIAEMLKGFSVQITYANSKSSSLDIELVAAKSDIIFVCLKSTEETIKLVSEKFIYLMKNGSLLVNTSRGKVVDQVALISRLMKDPTFSAGIDVFCDEPDYGEETPQDIKQLANLTNILATPHIAYKTIEARERLFSELTAVIKGCLEGKLINIVN